MAQHLGVRRTAGRVVPRQPTTHPPSLDCTGAIGRTRRAKVLLATLLAVFAADQLAKGWVARHGPRPEINSGAHPALGTQVTSWLRDSTLGAISNSIAVLILLGLGVLLVRRARNRWTVAGGALSIAGWASNVADRLGMHGVTMPGSTRGVVDFIPGWGEYWNVADFFIIAGAVLLAMRLVVAATHVSSRPTAERSASLGAGQEPYEPR